MKKGETLLEVVVAVSVLMIIMGPASAIIVNSIRNTAMSRDSLIAAGLAEEGVEMVRNMRDTNFLRFSSDKENCWNVKPGVDCFNAAGAVIADSKIGAPTGGAVTLDVYKNFKLTLDPVGLTWDLEDGVADISADTGYRLWLHSSSDIYFSSSSVPATIPSSWKETQFRRQIKIKYLNLDADAGSIPEAMSVVSEVTYKAGAKPQSVKRAVILTNKVLQ